MADQKTPEAEPQQGQDAPETGAEDARKGPVSAEEMKKMQEEYAALKKSKAGEDGAEEMPDLTPEQKQRIIDEHIADTTKESRGLLWNSFSKYLVEKPIKNIMKFTRWAFPPYLLVEKTVTDLIPGIERKLIGTNLIGGIQDWVRTKAAQALKVAGMVATAPIGIPLSFLNQVKETLTGRDYRKAATPFGKAVEYSAKGIGWLGRTAIWNPDKDKEGLAEYIWKTLIYDNDKDKQGFVEAILRGLLGGGQEESRNSQTSFECGWLHDQRSDGCHDVSICVMEKLFHSLDLECESVELFRGTDRFLCPLLLCFLFLSLLHDDNADFWFLLCTLCKFYHGFLQLLEG